MINKWLRKYFATVFVLATLMGVFHHHTDLKVHEDCQICTIASSIADADTPIEQTYLLELQTVLDTSVVCKVFIYLDEVYKPLNSRAPPVYS
ncbi:MAG: hypothetical protein Q9M40_07935 [Sulfurimonas sp.]|nr:hypothetical protein [Sulfurimonas sp.]